MFKPWVGASYGASDLFGGKRILVVGESHHSREHPLGSVVPDLTQRVMAHYRASQARGMWMRTLDNVAWALSGKSRYQLSNVNHRGEYDVWDKIAFYNYIPVVLAEGARDKRPTPEHYLMAVEPFDMVLKELLPEILIISGYGLLPWLIKAHWPNAIEKPWDFKGDFVDVASYTRLRVIRMIHPSSGFSHARWHKILATSIMTKVE